MPKVKLITKVGIFLTILMACQLFAFARACPCDGLVVPQPPEMNQESGLRQSYQPEFQKEFLKTIQSAKLACEKYKGKPHVAIVSDIDETLLDNREEYTIHPKEVSTDHKEWINQSRAPVWQPTAEFLLWARDNGFAIFLVSGRTEEKRRATIENLRKHNIVYDGLFLRRDMKDKQAGNVKANVRQEIEKMGFTIVVNIGDQWSDLVGGHAIDCEKLPNLIYFIR